jgi:hypothetical protein
MKEDAKCTLRLVGDASHDAVVSGDVSGDKQWRKETVTNSEVIRSTPYVVMQHMHHAWTCARLSDD